jgi:hypothetical protein
MATASPAVFHADHVRLNTALQAADAVVTDADGFQWIDTSKVPARLVGAYSRLMQYGYANGLLP